MSRWLTLTIHRMPRMANKSHKTVDLLQSPLVTDLLLAPQVQTLQNSLVTPLVQGPRSPWQSPLVTDLQMQQSSLVSPLVTLHLFFAPHRPRNPWQGRL